MTFEQTLIISILSAVVAGALSILGVVLTLRQNNKQLIIERQERREEKIQKIWDTRPEFEVVNYDRTILSNGYLEESEQFIFDCLIEPYNIHKISNKEKQWVRIDYTLKNIGKEMIEYMDFVPLQRGVFFYDIRKDTNLDKFEIGAFKEKATKCITYYGDKVRQGDTIKIRILFLKELEPVNFPTVSCCIAYKSFNKKYWRQNFYIPSKTLEESMLITEKEYNELTTRVE